MANQTARADHTAAKAKPSLTIKKRIKASPDKVWAAWTDPEKIKLWWGPDITSVLHAETDPRVGGRFRVAMSDTDGEVHDVSGTYKVFTPHEKFVMSWAWITTPERESQVTVTLKADGAETILTLLHEQFFDEAARIGHNRGWSESLAKLEALFA